MYIHHAEYIHHADFFFWIEVIEEEENKETMAISLNNLVGVPLTWIPTAAFKDRYTLTAQNSNSLANLDMSNWSSKAIALVPEGTLFLHNQGWSGRKVAIALGEKSPPFVTFERGMFGSKGNLVFTNGRSITWKNANLFGTKKVWVDTASNVPFVYLKMSSFSRKITVTIEPPAVQIRELSLLFVLGLYNIIAEKRKEKAVKSMMNGM
jgi:hypothetical protein